MRTRSPRLAIVGAATLIALLAACGQEDAGGTDAGSGGTAVNPSPTESTPVTSALDPEVPESVIDESIAMLADQLDVAPDEIKVARAIEMTWRDGSIGCAEDGMNYTQALVDGVLVELVVDGESYEFHQGGEQPPFYCEHPTKK